jgi:hypothetical protein
VLRKGEIMKIGLLVISVIGLSVTCTNWANDLPSLRYSPGIPVKDLVARRYRWVTVNGPYACVTEQDVRQITSDHTDLRELHMVENLQAYYLIPGTLARVIRADHANGMSEFLLAGITTPLWTYTRFLSARPIQDTYGVIETPDNAGLVNPRDAAIVGETDGRTLNERAQARTP